MTIITLFNKEKNLFTEHQDRLQYSNLIHAKRKEKNYQYTYTQLGQKKSGVNYSWRWN